MTRPEKIEEKVAQALADFEKAVHDAISPPPISMTVSVPVPAHVNDTRRRQAHIALAALSVEDLLSLAFTEEERDALYWTSAVKEDPAISVEAWDSARAKLRGSDDR